MELTIICRTPTSETTTHLEGENLHSNFLDGGPIPPNTLRIYDGQKLIYTLKEVDSYEEVIIK